MDRISLISIKERNLNGIDFFLLWIGAAISLAEVWAGGMLAPLGLATGISVIIIGHIIGNTPFSLGGIIGTKYGIPTMVTLRPSFGIRGSYIGSILNIIQLTGWTAIMLIVSSNAAYKVYPEISKNIWLISIGIATTIWAIGGSKYWKWAGRIGVTALTIICIMSTYYLFKTYTPHTVRGILSIGTALDLVIAMPISWLPLVSDYSRYAKDTRSAFWGTWLGYLIGSSWMYALGLAAFLSTGSSDIITVMVKLGATGMALLLILLSTITSTFLDIYSTAVSSLNISPRINRFWSMIAAGAAGTIVGLIFPSGAYEDFLLLIGAMFCPIFGIVLSDYFIKRRGKLKIDHLFKQNGEYWYNKGVNWWAIISWGIGFGFYEFITIKAPEIGASIPSMLIAGTIYLLKRRKKHEL